MVTVGLYLTISIKDHALCRVSGLFIKPKRKEYMMIKILLVEDDLSLSNSVFDFLDDFADVMQVLMVKRVFMRRKQAFMI